MQPLIFSATLSPWVPGLVSLAVYAVLVIALTAFLLFLSGWLGERKPGLEKARPYECGIVPTGPPRLTFPVPFHLVAVFFLVFDVGAAFIFSWATAVTPLGWTGWITVSAFTAILLLGWLYILKKGGLSWGPGKSARPPSPGAR